MATNPDHFQQPPSSSSRSRSKAAAVQHHIDLARWHPVPLVAVACLNNQRQLAASLLATPEHELVAKVAACGEGSQGRQLAAWLYSACGVHALMTPSSSPNHQSRNRGSSSSEEFDLRSLKKLLRRLGGAAKDVNGPVDVEGRSALMLLALYGVSATSSSGGGEKPNNSSSSSAESNDSAAAASVCQLLLDHGASALMADEEGSTALTLAAATGRLPVVTCLARHLIGPNTASVSSTSVGSGPMAEQLGAALLAAVAGGSAEVCHYLVNELRVPVDSVDPEDGCSLVQVATLAACVKLPPTKRLPPHVATTLALVPPSAKFSNSASKGVSLKHMSRASYVPPLLDCPDLLVKGSAAAMAAAAAHSAKVLARRNSVPSRSDEEAARLKRVIEADTLSRRASISGGSSPNLNEGGGLVSHGGGDTQSNTGEAITTTTTLTQLDGTVVTTTTTTTKTSTRASPFFSSSSSMPISPWPETPQRRHSTATPSFEEEIDPEAAAASEFESHTLRVLQWLLVQGADVSIADADGYTPFSVASLKGNVTIAELLLAHVPITFGASFVTGSAKDHKQRRHRRKEAEPVVVQVEELHAGLPTSSQAPLPQSPPRGNASQPQLLSLTPPDSDADEDDEDKKKNMLEADNVTGQINVAEELFPQPLDAGAPPLPVPGPEGESVADAPPLPPADAVTAASAADDDSGAIARSAVDAAVSPPPVLESSVELPGVALEEAPAEPKAKEEEDEVGEDTGADGKEKENAEPAADIAESSKGNEEVDDADSTTANASALAAGKSRRPSLNGPAPNAKKLVGAFGEGAPKSNKKNNSTKGKNLLQAAKKGKKVQGGKLAKSKKAAAAAAAAAATKSAVGDQGEEGDDEEDAAETVEKGDEEEIEVGVVGEEKTEIEGADGEEVVKGTDVAEEKIETDGKSEAEAEIPPVAADEKAVISGTGEKDSETAATAAEEEKPETETLESEVQLQASNKVAEDLSEVKEELVSTMPPEEETFPLEEPAVTDTADASNQEKVEESPEEELPPENCATTESTEEDKELLPFIIGQKLIKTFGEFGDFEGIAEAYDESTGWWRVVYEDGEEEDLYEQELQPLVDAWLAANTTVEGSSATTTTTSDAASPSSEALAARDEGPDNVDEDLSTREEEDAHDVPTPVEASEDESYVAPSAASVLDGNFVDDNLDEERGELAGIVSNELNVNEEDDEEHEYTDDDDDEGGGGGAMDEAAEAMAFMMAALGGGKGKAASPSKEKQPKAARKEEQQQRQPPHKEPPASSSSSKAQAEEEPIDLPTAPPLPAAAAPTEPPPAVPEVVSTPYQRPQRSGSTFEHEQAVSTAASNPATDADTEQSLVPALLAYVNYRCKDGMTALHLATAENHAPTVGWLLSLGADAMLRNALGERPLYTACKLGHTPCVRLLAASDPTLGHGAGPRGASALLAACVGGHVRCVDALERAATQRENAGSSHHHHNHNKGSSNSSNNNKSLSRFSEGARLLRQDLDAVLLECCRVGTPVAVAEYLLSAGADLNTTNGHGETPIMVASRFDRKDLVQFLLHRSCDFASGRTARRHRSSIGGGAY